MYHIYPPSPGKKVISWKHFLDPRIISYHLFSTKEMFKNNDNEMKGICLSQHWIVFLVLSFLPPAF